MSAGVLSGPFLDFGASLWRSDRMHTEFPGLAAKGFTPTGRFGIGFFSVFMWGGTVQVRTRRYDAAQSDTWVLEFTRGLLERPLLRRAQPAEYLRDGGTTVRVRLDGASFVRDLVEGRQGMHGTFEQECARLCATADVNIIVGRNTQAAVPVVAADDWLTMDGVALLDRVARFGGHREVHQRQRAPHAARLRVVRDDRGRPIGRACLVVPPQELAGTPGAVCVGGFAACGMHGIAGVLLGSPTSATRQEAIPLLRGEALAAFVTEQVALITAGYWDAGALIEVAKFASRLGGDLGTLPVARTARGLVSTTELREWLEGRDAIVLASEKPFRLADDASFQLPRGVPLPEVAATLQAETTLADDVVLVRPGGMGVLNATRGGLTLDDEWLDVGGVQSIARLHDPLVAHALECVAAVWEVASYESIEPQLREVDVAVGTLRGTALIGQGYRLARPSRANP